MTTYTGFEVAFRYMSVETAASLQVSTLFSVSEASSSVALLFDAILHTDFYKRVDLASGISYIKKMGTGLRIAMKASGIDTKASLTFASVAAQITLQKASAEYRVHGIALSDDILKSLMDIPITGNLSSDVYRAMQNTISTSLPAYLRSADVGPGEYSVPIPSHQDVPRLRARSINYAVSMVAQRQSLVNATNHRPAGVSPEVIAVVYARFLGSVATSSDRQPTQAQADQASRWLATGIIS